MKYFKLLFLTIILLKSLLYSESYFSFKNNLKFADFLYQEKDFNRAITEYKRTLFLPSQNKKEKNYIYYKIALSYYNLNKYNTSFNYFNKYLKFEKNMKNRLKVLYNISVIYYKVKNKKSLIKNKKFFSNISNTNLKTKYYTLLSLNYLRDFKFKKAKKYSNLSLQKDKINRLILKYKSTPPKNMIISAFLSTIIPGAGKIYLNRFWDGLMSFFLIGVTTWQSYDGFSKDGIKSTKGWIYGTIAGSLYLGNIYGSIVGVRIYNYQIKEKLKREINVQFKTYFNIN